MSHRKAVALMILITLLWSTAGVVTRQLESTGGFELTFWRSAFNALALLAALRWMRGPALWGQVLRAPRAARASALCWAVMFSAFMLALTMTSVANVLVMMSAGPLLTALLARSFADHHLPPRTWAAIALGSAGIAWMFGQELGRGAGSLAGMAVALCVPLASALNWTLLQRARHAADAGADMLGAVMLGALLSAALMLPLAWPLRASVHDLGLLAGLGLFQLALPCVLVVRLTRHLPAPELALLSLLETVFGVLWAWLGAGEVPSAATLGGGAMVLLALAGNELLGMRGRLAAAH